MRDARLGDVVLGQLRGAAGSSTRAGGRSRRRRNAASPRFHALLLGDRPLAADGAAGRSTRPTTRARRSATTSTRRGYSERFRSHFLVPLTSALWSTAPGRALEFPAAYAIRFFDNHGMLGFGRFRWRTVTGGSRVYVVARSPSGSATRLRLGQRGARRSAATPDGVELRAGGRRGRGASTRSSSRRTPTRRSRCSRIRAPEERRALGGFAYTVERDRAAHRRVASSRARARRARRGTTGPATTGEPTLTYYLNRLQRLEADARLLRDAQPGRRPRST